MKLGHSPDHTDSPLSAYIIADAANDVFVGNASSKTCSTHPPCFFLAAYILANGWTGKRLRQHLLNLHITCTRSRRRRLRRKDGQRPRQPLLN